MMRTSRCKEILLLEDIAGTGGHALKFLKGLYSHPTIKSWLSLKYLRFTILVYATTTQAKKRIEANPYVNAVVSEHELEPGRAIWTDEQRHRILYLCRHYAKRTSRPWYPLGLGDAFTCVVFQHKCPNTVPPILWAGSKNWVPLFNPRPSIDLPVWPVQVTPDENCRRMLEGIGQKRLSDVDLNRYITSEGLLRIMTLAAAAKRITRLPVLADILNVSTTLAGQYLEGCIRNGWLTWEHDLTEEGQAMLDHARRLGAVPVGEPQWSDSFYFPATLRGARRSFSEGR
jgi:hypothetical protein